MQLIGKTLFPQGSEINSMNNSHLNLCSPHLHSTSPCVRGESGGIRAKCGLAVDGFWLASSSHVLGLSPVGCEMPRRVTATYNVESLTREFTVQQTTLSMGLSGCLAVMSFLQQVKFLHPSACLLMKMHPSGALVTFHYC